MFMLLFLKDVNNTLIIAHNEWTIYKFVESWTPCIYTSTLNNECKVTDDG